MLNNEPNQLVLPCRFLQYSRNYPTRKECVKIKRASSFNVKNEGDPFVFLKTFLFSGNVVWIMAALNKCSGLVEHENKKTSKLISDKEKVLFSTEILIF